MQNGEGLTAGQIKEFLKGSEGVNFAGQNKREVYAWIEEVLVAQELAQQDKKQRGAIRAYVEKVTGLGSAQVTRLVRMFKATGSVEVKACDGGQCRNYGTESGLRRTEVLTALEDREGSLWLGYSGHGLARWLGRDQWQSFTEEEGLGSPGIWRIVRDTAGDLWIGTSRGLFHGFQNDGRWQFRRSDAVGDLRVYGLEVLGPRQRRKEDAPHPCR